MEITLTLPAHVAAVFTDENEAADWLIARATERARSVAVAIATEQARQIIAESSVPFDDDDDDDDDNVEVPNIPTVAEQVQSLRVRLDRVPQLATTAVDIALDSTVEILDGNDAIEVKNKAMDNLSKAINGETPAQDIE